MDLHALAVLMTDPSDLNWPVLAAMLTVISIAAALVSAVISAFVVKPLIQASENRLTEKIDEVKDTMVSKEIFNIYKEVDAGEHKEMKLQLQELASAINNGGGHRR